MSDLLESDKAGFMGHVFNFNTQSKHEMMNVVQYAVTAIIPVVILNKIIQRFVPEVDEEKGSLEIGIEVIIQIILMFLGMFFIDRLITFVPTYSELKYPLFDVTSITLSVLMITMSLQTRLGGKVSILTDRVMELWSESSDKKKKIKNVKTSQPISQQQQQQQQQPPPPSQYPGSTSIGSLPDVNYDAMYQQQPTPLVGASQPGAGMESMESMEPIAANSGGGSAFGSLF